MGRGRARRNLRRQAAAVFRAGAVERARPDPEGAPVRPHQQRGQPRRGREGVLLLPRQHAHALVHEVSLQVPAAGVPVRGPGRDQPRGGRARSSSTSCSIPASSTRTATSTCSSSTRRQVPKTCSSASPSTTAGPRRRGCACCRRCGSATPGRGATDGPKPTLREGGAGRHPGLAPRARRVLPALRRRAGAALHREREQSSASGASPTRRRTSRTRSTPTSSRDKRRGEPGETGPRRRRTTCSKCPAAAARSSACVCRRPGPTMPSAVSRRSSTAASRRPTSSTSGSRRRSLTEDQRRVHRQALAGMLWSKQYYYFDLERWLQEHESHPLLESARPRRAQHRVVPHVQRRHHLHARQVGVPVVRGVGSRVPHDRAVARRLRLRQGAAAADAAQPLLPSERADPRLRVELQRRQSAGARLGHALSLQDGEGRSAGRTCGSWSARSRA